MADVEENQKLGGDDLKETVTKRLKSKQLLSHEHIQRKRLPQRLSKRNTDIYVTNKTNFKAQLNKCEKLLDAGESEIIIHGLGAAINRACNLGLQLKENHHGTVDLDIKTSTVDLIVRWLGLTIFEIWINLVSLTIFTFLIGMKLDENHFAGPSGWWIVFAPLFVADGLNTYFCAIIFIRMHMEGMMRVAILRALWSLMFLILVFVFKYLLCKKLSGQSTLEYSEVLSPVFILLQLIAVRACQLH